MKSKLFIFVLTAALSLSTAIPASAQHSNLPKDSFSANGFIQDVTNFKSLISTTSLANDFFPNAPNLDYEPMNDNFRSASSIATGVYPSAQFYKGYINEKTNGDMDYDFYRFNSASSQEVTITFLPPDSQNYGITAYELAELERVNGNLLQANTVAGTWVKYGEMTVLTFIPKPNTRYIFKVQSDHPYTVPSSPYLFSIMQK